MVFNAGIALIWLMFLALFPLAFIWLRRAWRIFVRRDFSEVALKRGEPPASPARFAPYAGLINLICGVAIACVIVGVIAVGLKFETWTAAAGITIWGKFIADFILSRHAHLISLGRKKS
jgi:hypothetical protein